MRIRNLNPLKLLPVALILGSQTVAAGYYGHVNRGYLWVDDGYQTTTYHTDFGNSSTRFGFTDEYKMNDTWSSGAKIEIQIESNSTFAVTQTNHNPKATSSDDVWGLRKAEVWFVNQCYGKLSIGHGATASDNTSEKSFTEAGSASSTSPSDFAGGIGFHRINLTTVVHTTTPSVADVMSALDGFGRRNRVRYDTPNLHGFVGSASVNQATNTAGGNWDLGLVYNTAYEDWKFIAAVGYGQEKNRHVMDGSMAVKHVPTGINAAVAMGRHNLLENAKPHGGAATTSDAPNYTGRTLDPQFRFWQIGVDKNWYECGTTGFVADMFRSRNMTRDNERGHSWGFGMVQHVEKLKAQFYASYHNYRYQDGRNNVAVTTSYDYHPINVIFVGAKVSL